MIIKHKGKDITNLITRITWSGSRLQASRSLQFSYIFEPHDSNIELYVLNLGETIRAYDDDNNLIFQGNIYKQDRDVSSSTIDVLCYDNLYILNKSKTTRKFNNMTPEGITSEVCHEMGIKVGNLAKTGKKMTFIASEKSGYEIIMMAYSRTGKKYQPIMNGDKLDVVEKGTLIEDYESSSDVNTENSTYFESIENMINAVKVTDEQGNLISYERNQDWISKYSMIQAVYKSSPKKNTHEQVKRIMKGVDRGGTLELLGDYRVKSSYSIKIKDIISQLTGKFWIKSDTHTFENGMHDMRLEIEFENMMEELHDTESGT